MSKHKAYIFLGLWIAVLPFLGFPRGMKDILLSVSGALVALMPMWFLVYHTMTTRRPRRRGARRRVLDDEETDGSEGGGEAEYARSARSSEDHP